MDQRSDDDEMLLGQPPTAPAEDAPAVEGAVDGAEGDADVDALAAAMDGDDSDEDSDSDSDAAEGGDDAAAAAGGDGEAGDAAAAEEGGPIDLSAIKSKKEAKATLNKKLYKKWKKKFGKKSKKDKKAGKKDKKSSKKDKKSSKDKSGDKPRRKSSGDDKKQKRSKKHRAEGDDGDDSSAGPMSDTGSDDEGRPRRARRASAKKKGGEDQYDFGGNTAARLHGDKPKAKKAPTGKALVAHREQEAQRVVDAMREAREKDALALRSGTAPLHRIQIVPLVRAAGNRIDMHENLVNAGFLRELCGWMCVGKQLAPVDLRTAALGALEQFKFEHVEGGKLPASAKNGKDYDVIGYEGVSKEQLKETNLGFCANTLRNSAQETAENRRMAAFLLQRLSRAFAGERPEPDMEKVKRWQHQGDATVLPPFEALKTKTETFVEKTTKVNPLDPRSYLKVPPLRLRPTYITGVFNYAGDE